MARASTFAKKNRAPMGLAVEANDLRLFVICSAENAVDMEKVEQIHRRATKKAAEVHASGSDDGAQAGGDGATQAVHPTSKAVKPNRSHKNDGSSTEEDFATAMNRRLKGTSAAPGQTSHAVKAHKKHRKRTSDSSSECAVAEEPIDEDAFMFEKQDILKELGRLQRNCSINFDEIGGMPTLKDSILHLRKVRDWAMRQNAVTDNVEMILNVIKYGAPVIEATILTNMPLLNVRSWSMVVGEHIDFMRGPVTEIWRRHMLMFGVQMSPWITLGVLLFGSMLWVSMLNTMGWEPVSGTRFAINFSSTFLGMHKTPAPPGAKSPMAGLASKFFPQANAAAFPQAAQAAPTYAAPSAQAAQPGQPAQQPHEGRRRTMARPSNM